MTQDEGIKGIKIKLIENKEYSCVNIIIIGDIFGMAWCVAAPSLLIVSKA